MNLDMWNRPIKPVYVERSVAGRSQWLKVDDWHWEAWNGCFCLITDKARWM